MMRSRAGLTFSAVGITLQAICLCASFSPAQAADHQNLEENLPVKVEDAYPIAFRGRELQGYFRLEKTADGKDRFLFEPRLELGFARNWQMTLSSPLLWGNADHTGSRNFRLAALHNFNQESLSTPAFALAARAEFPTGVESAGVDTELKFIATKTLGHSSMLHQVHLNAAWLHNSGRMAGERGDRYHVALGYSRRLGPDTMLVGDVFREQDRERGKTINMVELGIRRQLTPLTVFTLGAGAGIGGDSPDYRVTVGFQHSLKF
jgi:hypothetical protein